MQQKGLMYSIGTSVVLAIIAVVVAVVISNGQTTSKLNNADRSMTLWNIQPGLGTIMIEYGARMNNAWWAVDADNWDMAKYQVKEMTEIQEVGEVTRPSHADALKKFEKNDIDPMMQAVDAKDKDAFVAAYDKAITGCNQCHGDTKGKDGSSYRFVKIIRPTGNYPFSNVDWAGQ